MDIKDWQRNENENILQSFAGDEDEQAAHSYVDEKKQSQHRHGAGCERFLHKRLSYPVEIKQRVLAEANHGENRVEHILMCEDEIDGYGEW